MCPWQTACHPRLGTHLEIASHHRRSILGCSFHQETSIKAIPVDWRLISFLIRHACLGELWWVWVLRLSFYLGEVRGGSPLRNDLASVSTSFPLHFQIPPFWVSISLYGFPYQWVFFFFELPVFYYQALSIFILPFLTPFKRIFQPPFFLENSTSFFCLLVTVNRKVKAIAIFSVSNDFCTEGVEDRRGRGNYLHCQQNALESFQNIA